MGKEDKKIELECKITALNARIKQLELENKKLKSDLDIALQILGVYWDRCAHPVYKEMVDQPKIPRYYADDLYMASDMEALSDRVRLEYMPYVFLIKS